MSRKPRFYIHTLGCKVNQAESENIAAALIARGFEQTALEQADIAILNTCTVTGEADAKNRKELRGMLKSCVRHVLVCGCAVNIDADIYAAIDERVCCISEKRKLPDIASKLVCAAGQAVTEPQEHGDAPLSQGPQSRTRADLKIQDGCDHACNYCIVHTARGPARSERVQNIISRARTLAARGTHEIVLVGIDLGAYFSDGLDLADLLQLLGTEVPSCRFRITSIEPPSVTDSLIKIMAESNGTICRHLHLCLQSGSDKVLHDMNRGYNAREFMDLVSRIRFAQPRIALSTDVIAGFPGETDDDFEQTCEIVCQAGFMRLHVFRYSKRPGTPAAERSDQIDPHISAARARHLRALGEELARADMQRRIGTQEQVLVERAGQGTSESYHTVQFDGACASGELVECEFYDIDDKKRMLVGRRVR